MAKRIKKTTPKQDGFRMPGEYEPQEKVWNVQTIGVTVGSQHKKLSLK